MSPALPARRNRSLRLARVGLRRFVRRHHLALDVTLFVAGFLFDVSFTQRIDSWGVLAHQSASLALCLGLVAWDHRLTRTVEPAGWWGVIARRRQWVMHLIFGGLLNVFLVFFFRSSGNALALVFVAVLLVLLVLNELPRFRQRGPLVRVALLSFSMTAFLMYLLPIVTGTLHRWQPVAAVAIGAVLTLALWRFLVWLTPDPTWTFRRAGLPGLVIQVGLLGLLVGDLVPPVPLALKHIGIYTSVKPAPDGAPMHVFLTWQPAEAWEVWRRDARTLVADAGQQVWVYARVFAPMAFDDEIVFVWERAEPDGWVALGPPQPEPLHGGMDEGFRVFAARPLTHAGDYRVRLLAEDGREIGRRAFTFAPGAPPRSQSGVD